MQKEDVKVLIPNSAPEVGQGVSLGEHGQASQGPGEGLCLSWLVVSSVPHCKSSSLYALFLYATNHHYFVANIEQLPMPSKLYWFQNHPSSLQSSVVHAGHAVPSTLLSSWDIFLVISKLNCWLEMFIPPQTPTGVMHFHSYWVFIDHVSFE